MSNEGEFLFNFYSTNLTTFIFQGHAFCVHANTLYSEVNTHDVHVLKQMHIILYRLLCWGTISGNRRLTEFLNRHDG